MKKLFLLAFLFCLKSCVAQQFERGEAVKTKRLDVIATVKHSTDSGSVLVGERLSFQVDVPMEMNWEYRAVLDMPHDFDREKVIPATVVQYHITPWQAWQNIIKMFEESDMPPPVKKSK